MNFNKVLIAGNLTRDPEMRYTSKGTAICKIGMAVNRVWKNEAGEKKEEVTFVDVDCFGRTAENIAQYFRKGASIFIEGRLKLDSWEDKQTGARKQKLGVIADSFQFVGGKREAAPSAPAAPRSKIDPADVPPRATAPPADVPPMDADDGVPF